MSAESMQWLHDHIRVGYTDERGPAWHARDSYMTDGTHFPGAVPEEEVSRILDVPFIETQHHAVHVEYFHVGGCPEAGKLYAECDCPRSETPYVDKTRKNIVSPDDGHVHGTFKLGWQLHGYQQWTADQIAAILDQSRGELGTASVGLLQQRSLAFIQAKLDGSALEVGGYGFVPYIVAATSVNGTLSSTYGVGIEGVVCDNTLAAFWQTALKILKVKHSRNSAGRLGDVRDALALVYQAADDFATAADALQNVTVTAADFDAWRNEMAPVPERDPKSSTGGIKYTNARKVNDRYTELWTYDPKVTPWAGTAFGIVQLDNTYRTWDRGVKGADGGRLERNLLNMVDGTTGKEDSAALAALAKVMGDRLVTA
jgi:phage/plasmid-like protein (TIGR03299 family)